MAGGYRSSCPRTTLLDDDPKTKSPPSKLTTGNTASGGTNSTTTNGNTSGSAKTTASGSGGTNSVGTGGSGESAVSTDSGGSAGQGGETGTGGSAVSDPCGSAGAGGEPQSGDELFFEDFESDSDRWESSDGVTFGVVNDDESMSNALGNGEVVNKPRAAFVSDACFVDLVVEARVKVLDFSGSRTTCVAGPCLRIETEDDYYIVGVQSTGNAGLVRVSGGHPSSLHEPVVDLTDSTFTFGSIGVCTINADAVFDDVRVTVP